MRAGDSFYRDAADSVRGGTDVRASVWRWRPAFQADFQARLDWCVTDFAGANHRPVAVLNGDGSRRVLMLTVRSGETVALSAAGSRDADGDALEVFWSVYPEAGTFRGPIQLTAEGLTTRFVGPQVRAPQTVHVILEVRDDGEPRLSAFRRAVITVWP